MILHSEILAHQPAKIKEAVSSKNAPKVLVLPTEGLSAADAEKILKESGLWFIQ